MVAGGRDDVAAPAGDDRRAAVLGLELADLPLAGEQPQRVGGPGGERRRRRRCPAAPARCRDQLVIDGIARSLRRSVSRADVGEGVGVGGHGVAVDVERQHRRRQVVADGVDRLRVRRHAGGRGRASPAAPVERARPSTASPGRAARRAARPAAPSRRAGRSGTRARRSRCGSAPTSVHSSTSRPASGPARSTSAGALQDDRHQPVGADARPPRRASARPTAARRCAARGRPRGRCVGPVPSTSARR